jgi:predicted MPP superfamily phosphohydrolase
MTIQELLNQQINAGIIKQRLHPCQFLNQTHKAIAFKTGKIVQTSLPIDIDPTDVVLKDFKESKDNKPNEYMVIPASLYQYQFYGSWNNTFFIIRAESELTYEYIKAKQTLFSCFATLFAITKRDNTISYQIVLTHEPIALSNVIEVTAESISPF